MPPAAMRTREALIAATWAVLARDPHASLAEIAAAAGLGRATLHRHVAGRAQLRQAAAIAALTRLRADLVAAHLERKPPAEALAETVRVLIEAGPRLRFLVAAPEPDDDAALAAPERAVDALVERVFARAVAAGLLRADVPAAWMSAAVEALLFAAWTEIAAGRLALADAPGLLLDTIALGMGAASKRTLARPAARPALRIRARVRR